jgi:hypothetical protein
MVVTSPASEDSGHWIAIPIDKRLVSRWIDVPHHLLHDMTIVNDDIIEVLWNIGEGIDPYSIRPIFPS